MRGLKSLSPRIVILVSPALRTGEGHPHRCTWLTTCILLPQMLRDTLITVEKLAGLVNLVDVTILTFST
jgi:hypothetical protein